MLWYRRLAAKKDIDQLAQECAGNWHTFSSFVWWGEPEWAGDAYLFYTCNRDSSVLEDSNAAAIQKVLEREEFEADVSEQEHSHWACGWVKGYAIRTIGEDGKATPAFKALVEIACQLDEYPLLDEDDFSERELEAANVIWRDCYNEKERIAYIRRYRSQFEFRAFADMLSCVRGHYFAGYASELIDR